MTEYEYYLAEREKALKCPPVKSILGLLESAISDCLDEKNTGGNLFFSYCEHKELISAWRNGLDWFSNHNGGYAIQKAFEDYIVLLADLGYTGEEFAEVYADYNLVPRKA